MARLVTAAATLALFLFVWLSASDGMAEPVPANAASRQAITRDWMLQDYMGIALPKELPAPTGTVQRAPAVFVRCIPNVRAIRSVLAMASVKKIKMEAISGCTSLARPVQAIHRQQKTGTAKD